MITLVLQKYSNEKFSVGWAYFGFTTSRYKNNLEKTFICHPFHFHLIQSLILLPFCWHWRKALKEIFTLSPDWKKWEIWLTTSLELSVCNSMRVSWFLLKLIHVGHALALVNMLHSYLCTTYWIMTDYAISPGITNISSSSFFSLACRNGKQMFVNYQEFAFLSWIIRQKALD